MRCYQCGENVSQGDEQIGSRCPRCRQPLYEDPRESRSLPAQQHSRCTIHEASAAIATCQRCGNYTCPVCLTRWQGQILCLDCVTRAVESKETSPLAARRHLRQAILSLLFGGAAWVIGLGSFALMVAGIVDGEPDLALLILGVFGLLATPLPALLGIGQGAAAIRVRGDHMILATLGLLLSALHTGIFLGLVSFALWQNQ